jgi:tRNA 2-thiocytidine biosynthesis protein TtcA
MVCLSGGKDSYGLLDVLLLLRERAPINFDLVAVNLDQKQPGFPEEVLPDYLRNRGVSFHIETQDTYSIVKRIIPEARQCARCAHVYGAAFCIASPTNSGRPRLRSDIIGRHPRHVFPEHVLWRTLKAMPPKLMSDDGKHIVIRPLAYVEEATLRVTPTSENFRSFRATCAAPSQSEAAGIKRMLIEWQKRYPGRVENIFNALARVTPSHLMDADLFDFTALRASGRQDAEGDIAFDDPPCGNEDDAVAAVIRFA